MIILLEGTNDINKSKFKKKLLVELTNKHTDCTEYELMRPIDKFTNKQFWNEFAALLYSNTVYIIDSRIIDDMIHQMLNNENVVISMADLMIHFDNTLMSSRLTIVYFDKETTETYIKAMYSTIMSAIICGTNVPVLPYTKDCTIGLVYDRINKIIVRGK